MACLCNTGNFSGRLRKKYCVLQQNVSRERGMKARFMQWTRTETLALAQQSCTQCHGLGLKPSSTGASTPCSCVFRAIFRACHRKFRECADREKHVSRVSLEANR